MTGDSSFPAIFIAIIIPAYAKRYYNNLKIQIKILGTSNILTKVDEVHRSVQEAQKCNDDPAYFV